MKVFNINDFRVFHPEIVEFKTDVYYLNVANVLYEIVSKSLSGRDMEYELKETIAMRVAHYFEDVVCDLGIWRAFTETHLRRYGRPLPFYSLDDIDEYYPDEVHLQDVQFIIWNVMQSAYEDRFMNPENPGFEALARSLYAELDKRFEQAPVNEQYKTFAYEIADANHPDAPFTLRNIWMWLLSANYLMTTGKVEEEMSLYEEKLSFIDNDEQKHYTSMSDASVRVRIGPLNMTAPEWYAAMCRSEESENAKLLAEKIEAMDYREITVYKMLSSKGDSIKIESPKGEVLDVPYSGFLDPDEVKLTTSKTSVFIGALLRWDNVWLPFGMTTWNNAEEVFVEMKDDWESRQRTAKFVPAKVKEKFGDQRLFFLKDKKKIKYWYKELFGKDVPMTDSSDDYYDFPDDEPIAMYLDDMGDFCIAPIAGAIALDDNPYYDPTFADELGLAVLMLPDFIDKAFTDYLVSNNLLPDAACNSLKGHEHGHKLIQSNIGFLKEYFRGIW